MNFRIERVYRDRDGIQKRFLIKSGTKLDIVDIRGLEILFRDGNCDNAILIHSMRGIFLQGYRWQGDRLSF